MRKSAIRSFIISTILICFTISYGQEVKFASKPLKRGSVRIDSSKMNMSFSMKMKINGQVFETMYLSSKNIEKKKETILKVKNGIVTKIKVTYLTSEEVSSEKDSSGKEKTKTKKNACSGKTYIVEKINNEIVIKYPDNSIPDEKEIQIVKNDYDELGEKDKLTEKLTSQPLRIGKRVKAIEQYARTAMTNNKEDSMKIKKISAVLVKTKRIGNKDCAVFKIIMVLEMKSNPMVLTMNINGEFILDVNTSQPVKMILKGPMTLTGQMEQGNAVILLEGDGNIEALFSMEVRY